LIQRKDDPQISPKSPNANQSLDFIDTILARFQSPVTSSQFPVASYQF
jgi:hypothetical protein